jgi:protein involved in polysaccharide export with SLBB domain
MTVIRFCRAAGLGALLAFVPSACATRRPETSIAAVPISRTVVWKVSEGDQLRVRIYREPDLSGESAVAVGGTAYFVGVGRVSVEGLTLDALQAELSARYAKFLVEAAVDVTMQRDIVVYGQVRTPGVFLVDPSMTVLGLLAKAGGASGMGRSPLLTLVKADGRQYRLPREARLSTMDITRNDAVFVQEESVWARNQQSFGAITLGVTLVTSILGLILVLTR